MCSPRQDRRRAGLGVDGYFFRYQRHFAYWRRLSNGDIGIVTIPHKPMHRIDRLREDFGYPAADED